MKGIKSSHTYETKYDDSSGTMLTGKSRHLQKFIGMKNQNERIKTVYSYREWKTIILIIKFNFITMTQLIYSKIPKIMSLVGVVGKDRTNTIQNYKFRGIDDMYNALNKHLSDEWLFFTSEVLDEKREERPSKQGGVLIWTILTVKFTCYAEDGSSISSTMKWEAMDSGDKSMNKAMSTAYKYALMQLFCIPTEEDKDTENQTHEVAQNSEQAKQTTQTIPVKVYPKSKLDEIVEQAQIVTDIEQLKQLFEEWKKLCKSEKQVSFFKGRIDNEKKRIEGLNVHTATTHEHNAPF